MSERRKNPPVTPQEPDLTILRFSKIPLLFRKVVFVDGIAHSGKLMLGPILSAYRGVELHRLDTVFEHVAVLQHFGKITMEGAVTLMRFELDEFLYNNMIGRGVNFRPTDESSVFNGLKQERYLRRLFDPTEGDPIIRRIAKERPIYQGLTHDMLGFAKPCFEAFDPDFFIIEMIRHPLNIAERWLNWGWGENRYEKDPRSFILTVESQGRAIPYFARDRSRSYRRLKPGDRVIFDVLSVWNQMLTCYQGLSRRRRERVLWGKFENFVTNPYPDLVRIERLLRIRRGNKLEPVLRQQRCPRELPRDDRPKLRALIQRRATPKGMRALDDMCEQYERFDPVSGR